MYSHPNRKHVSVIAKIISKTGYNAPTESVGGWGMTQLRLHTEIHAYKILVVGGLVMVCPAQSRKLLLLESLDPRRAPEVLLN